LAFGFFGWSESSAATENILLEYTSSNETETLQLPENGEQEVGGSRWSTTTRTRMPDRQGCEEITLTVKLLAGEAKSANVSFVREVTDWDPAGYVFVPAAVYNGNKFEVAPQGYPPLIREKTQFRVDMPITITDQPRLNKAGTAGKIELDTGGTTTPTVGIRTVDGKHQNLRCAGVEKGVTLVKLDGRSSQICFSSCPYVRQPQQHPPLRP